MNHEQTLEQLGVRAICFEQDDGIAGTVFALRDIMRLYRTTEELWVFRRIHPRHVLDRSPGATDMNFVFLTEQGVYDLMECMRPVEREVPGVGEAVKSLRAAVRGICDEYAEDFAGSYHPNVFPLQAKFIGLT